MAATALTAGAASSRREPRSRPSRPALHRRHYDAALTSLNVGLAGLTALPDRSHSDALSRPVFKLVDHG
jgi:hypothetical protein